MRIVVTRTSEDDRTRVVGCIASTWICTKSFWFLRPMDELLSFGSVRKPRSLTADVSISSAYCLWPSLVSKRILTSVFRITI